jgi:uncharacterized membrane protein
MLPAASQPVRLPLIDALRGFAIAQMIVYHFIWDLDHFGWITQAMNTAQPWVGWRSAIVTQFLLLVGVSLVLRTSFKPSSLEFWRRWAQVAGAALLVSVGSWWMFGPRFIYFGILHFVAAALILARPAVRLGRWSIVAGVALLALWLALRDLAWNATPMNILGLVTRKPPTEDYVPLLPWLAPVLIGIGLARLWQRRGYALATPLARLNEHPPRLLVLLGRWPLTIYLAHQPLLIGVLWGVKQITG